MKKNVIIIALVAVICLGVGAYFLFFREKPPEEPKICMYSPGESFITNVKDSKCLLKTTVVLELNQEGKEEFLDSKNGVIRDTIISTLRDKTEEQLRASVAQDELRQELVSEISEKLQIDYLQTMYFDDYVLQ